MPEGRAIEPQGRRGADACARPAGGGRHITGTGFTADLEKLNAATVLGYRVLRFTPQMVREGVMATVQAAIDKVLA